MKTLCALVAITFLPFFAVQAQKATEREPKALHIHLISGSKEYKSEASLRAWQKAIEKTHPVHVTASWVKDGAKELPEVDQIPKADLLLVFTRRMKLPEEDMKVLRAYWEAGKPVIGIRTASHAFQKEDNAVFDRQVLGGNYTGHFGNDPVPVHNVEAEQAHPVLAGVGEIVSRKLYKAGDLADTATCLQKGTVKGQVHAVTWVNTYKGGRQFYTSLGVPEDFQNPAFQRLLLNAIAWTGKTALKPKIEGVAP